MFVCICNAITDKQIRTSAEDGTTDLWGLQARLGVASGCGSCKETASEILAEYRRSANAGTGPVRESPKPQVYCPAVA